MAAIVSIVPGDELLEIAMDFESHLICKSVADAVEKAREQWESDPLTRLMWSVFRRTVLEGESDGAVAVRYRCKPHQVFEVRQRAVEHVKHHLRNSPFTDIWEDVL